MKLALTDPGVARDILVRYGYGLVDVCREEDTYLAHPCRDFAKTDEALRIRTRKCRNERLTYAVTYKGPREVGGDGFKRREEVELKLDESGVKSFERLMISLGFTRVISFSKLREIYEGRHATAFIDYLYNVGYFLELELHPGADRGVLSEMLEALRPISQVVGETYLEICLKTQKCLVVDDDLER